MEYFEANVAHSLWQADYFSCVGTIVHLRKENCMYQACPSQDCNKKVIDQQNGLYRCEKCDREFPNFKYRLMLLVSARITFQGVPCHVPSTIQSTFEDAVCLSVLRPVSYRVLSCFVCCYLSEGCFIELISSLFS